MTLVKGAEMSGTDNAKLIENEVIFKRLNDAMRDRVKAMFQGEARHVPLEMYCECSNEKCHQRVTIEPAAYEAAHSSTRRFIALEGHDTPDVEDVVERHAGYVVVQKHDVPSGRTDMRLNRTDL